MHIKLSALLLIITFLSFGSVFNNESVFFEICTEHILVKNHASTVTYLQLVGEQQLFNYELKAGEMKLIPKSRMPKGRNSIFICNHHHEVIRYTTWYNVD
ncbi:MAG: hypothetical protein MRY83_16410 [Flavobacteriales bacterium]|nr:hypothetical protein [Flavobacteriales bacterium]